MLLFNVFTALQNSALSTSYQGIKLTRADLDLAARRAVVCYRDLGRASKVEAYKEFVSFCEQSLTGMDERPLLPILISYLDEAKLAPDAFDNLTQIFSIHLKEQSPALTIVPMGRALIDQPNAFAAFLRYLVNQGVTPEQILSSHLLQDFFRYYLSTLAQDNNPIYNLFQLLKSNRDTAMLCSMAQKVHCPEGGLSSYALDGSALLAIDSLPDITPIEIPLQFTPSLENLTALHEIFGVHFLLGALHQHKLQSNNPRWIEVIANLFNPAHIVKTELPLLLNLIQEHPTAQQVLAELLTDQTLSTLVKHRIPSVLNLIPFHPTLASILPTENIEDFLRELQLQSSSGLALISSLCALLEGVKHSHEKANIPIFDALIDVIIENPCALDDPSLMSKLHKFSHGQDRVALKIRTLEDSLNSIFQLQAQNTLSDLDYITIEDVWRMTSEKIRRLQDIFHVETSCPTDKYKLYSRIALAFFNQHKVPFDLNEFIHAIDIEPYFDEKQVSAYERLLIELLGAVDNESLRSNCVAQLDAHVTKPWRTELYGNTPLLQHATLNGNIGLMQWVKTQRIKLPVLDKWVIDAAKANQWDMVRYLHNEYKLTTMTVNLLLYTAVAQNASFAIPSLWCEHRNAPDTKIIEKSLKLAVKYGNKESILKLIHCPQKPCDTAMANAFKNAMGSNQFDVAKLIAEASDGKLLQYAINNAALDAARFNRCDRLEMLASLTVNPLSQKVIENALMQAMRANQLDAVRWLTTAAPILPHLHAIKSAWLEARKQEKMDLVGYLNHFMGVEQVLSPNSRRKRSLYEIETIESEHLRRKPHAHQIKHATSCNGLLEHGFFKSVRTQQSGSYDNLRRQVP